VIHSILFRVWESLIAGNLLHLTPHTSHLTRHALHLTPHTSHITPHTSHLTLLRLRSHRRERPQFLAVRRRQRFQLLRRCPGRGFSTGIREGGVGQCQCGGEREGCHRHVCCHASTSLRPQLRSITRPAQLKILSASRPLFTSLETLNPLNF
jgi:hypothetical protein